MRFYNKRDKVDKVYYSYRVDYKNVGAADNKIDYRTSRDYTRYAIMRHSVGLLTSSDLNL